jgi:hypothetical protein
MYSVCIVAYYTHTFTLPNSDKRRQHLYETVMVRTANSYSCPRRSMRLAEIQTELGNELSNTFPLNRPCVLEG